MSLIVKSLTMVRYEHTSHIQTISNGCSYTLCSEKNTHSYFLSYLHDLFVDLNQKCSEYTQQLRDSDNVKLDIHCDR